MTEKETVKLTKTFLIISYNKRYIRLFIDIQALTIFNQQTDQKSKFIIMNNMNISHRFRVNTIYRYLHNITKKKS